MVVELLGGIEPARDYVLRAMRAGRHVITANKQLLSQHGEELFAAAGEYGVQLRFEAAVAGVVPVVRVLSESLAGAHIERIHGIVNGTTNFILSEMERGSTYAEALAEAQLQGYAEADPSEDVSGKDAAAKMAILARLAFGTPVRLDQVPYEGIEHLQGDDLQYARELGLGLKLDRYRRAARWRAVGARPSRFSVRRSSVGLRTWAFQRCHRRVLGHHRDHHVGAWRRRGADCLGCARRCHQRHASACCFGAAAAAA